jgi:transposase
MRSLMRERGVSTSVASLWRFFDLRGVSFKKKAFTQPQRRLRPSGICIF